jgi:hypothetical protein
MCPRHVVKSECTTLELVAVKGGRSVLNALHPDPQRYGLLLLHIVELLTSSGIRPPAEACVIDSGGSLERRF